ncbi:MAG TPA: acetyl-CoA carboxylase biotin carboxylase subunit [Vicinamibacterales bacterium]|nr:acetyl-CoA carboxylase biotin carboxylase subunit [Vicinamibacterales bacterium]
MKKLLIANRGEIAVRIIRTCREMGISPVSVYSECDRTALHVRLADEAYPIGPNAPRESYLRIDRILDVAKRSGSDAVHPGYGFLAENEEFAAAVEDAGITFVGPTARAIETMGSKTAARTAARRAGVPVVPGTEDPLGVDVPDAAIASIADAIGFPLLVKAVAGGGGKGMRAVADLAELPAAVRAARSEASAAFGDSAVYLERQLKRPRHIEVQLLGDTHGTVLPFVERECSIQRRHQKVVEETPSLAVAPALRARMMSAAAAVAAAVGYTSAGTIEFLLDEDGRFYFLEMNTRLQVEHPITEMVTGLDLVRWQIRIARGERLDLDPGSLVRGHAIECRIYAEDPDNGFLPSPGRILQLRTPGGPGIRDDSGATAGLDVPIFYDPMISKLVAWAEDRPLAIARMRRALGEYLVAGIKTTVPFFLWLFDQPEFVAGQFHTTYLDDILKARNGRPFVQPSPEAEEIAAIATALQAVLSPGAVGRAGPPATETAAGVDVGGRWKSQARAEGLRSL